MDNKRLRLDCLRLAVASGASDPLVTARAFIDFVTLPPKADRLDNAESSVWTAEGDPADSKIGFRP